MSIDRSLRTVPREVVALALAPCVAGAALWLSGLRVNQEGRWFWAVLLTALAVGFVSRTEAIRKPGSLVAGLTLGALAIQSPAQWLIGCVIVFVSLFLAHLVFPRLAPGASARFELAAYLGSGCAFPAILLGSLAALGGADARRVLASDFATAVDGETPLLTARALVSLMIGLATLSLVSPSARPSVSPRGGAVVARAAAVVLLAIVALRLAWVVSLASIPIDTLSWSEPPLLLNMLKLAAGLPLYGALEDANSYTYSPGTDLLHYALLRPLNLELTLLAHRVLAFAWQAAAAAVVVLALRRPLERALQPLLGPLTTAFVVAAAGVAVWSGLNAPYVHPDQLGKLFFALALALVIALPELPARWSWAALALIPPAATACKLTAAGLGVGLVLAVLWDRRYKLLLPLAAGGIAALATIPLFNATLGSFSLYAISIQASHRMEWSRAWDLVTDRPEGKIFAVAVGLALVAWIRQPRSPQANASMRTLLLSAGFGGVSLVAWLKNGGLDNNLVVLTVGATIVILLALAAHASPADDGQRSAQAVLGTLFFLSISLAIVPGSRPVLGESRARVQAQHQDLVRWLQEESRAGRRPLLYFGTKAWLDAGRNQIPLDCLPSALEAYLGGWPQVEVHIRRLFDGTYDGIVLTAAAVYKNPLIVHLRPRLESHFAVLGHPDDPWPPELQGIVILQRRKHPL